MLLRHGIQYLLARGVPGLINFLGIAIYTRLLDPAQYGTYTLTIAAVGTLDALLLQWLRLALLRFMPNQDSGGDHALATLFRIFIVVALATATVTGLAVWLLIHDPTLRTIVLLGAGVFLSQGAFELTVERERSELSPMRYGLYVGSKSVLGLIVGAVLAALGMGAAGLLIGLIASMVLPLLTFRGFRAWARALRLEYDPTLAAALFRYGLPLAATAVLAFVVSSSDRFMLAAFMDEAAAGQYAVGYDIAQFTLGMLLTIVNLAAYPLTVSALEKGGAAAARDMLRWTLRLLLAIGLPATVGIGLLSTNIATVVVGPEFEQIAAQIMPWIAVAALIAGLKTFYFDLAFQLGRSTITQLWIVLASAAGNVGLNLILIPRLGIAGAVYATLIAYVLALLLAWWLGRGAFAVPLPDASVLRLFGAAASMALVLLLVRGWSGGPALLAQVAVGGAAYLGSLLILDRGFFSRLAAYEAALGPGVTQSQAPVEVGE